MEFVQEELHSLQIPSLSAKELVLGHTKAGGCPALPVEVTVVPTEAIGVVTAMEGNVAIRGVSTAAAWVEVVDKKPVDGVKAPGLEKKVGQSVGVVVAAEARRALRSGVDEFSGLFRAKSPKNFGFRR